MPQISDTQEHSQCKESPLHRQRKSKALLAVIIIFLGIIFFLNNFGVLPWNSWTLIWRFWPVVLVLAGLQIAFGRCWLADFVITVLGLAVVTFILALAFSAANPDFNNFLEREFRFWNTGFIKQLTPRQEDIYFQDYYRFEI